MSKVSKKVISSLAVLSLIAGCGKDSGNSGSSSDSGTGVGRQMEEPAPVDGSNIVGHYQAKFITLNPHVNGTIPGSANFQRKPGEDRLYAYIRLFAGGVKAWHMQHVYTGGRCPTMSDDTNGDGFIDINEAEAVLGKILIPLDSDIGSQSSGRRFFPLADLSGYYHYERTTSFRRFLSDLQSPDKEPEDDTVKIAPGEGLRLEGKTLLIQGVTESIELPETVGTKGRHKPFQTFPIVCGVFEKVDKAPGEPYTDTGAPGPVADVIEGQDRPADENIPDTGETTGGTGGSSTTGTNDSDDGNGPVSDGSGRTSTGGSTSGDTTTGTTSGGTTGGTTTGGSAGDEDDDSTTGRTGRGRWTTGWIGGGWTGWTGGSGTTTGGSSGDTTTTGGVSSGDSSSSSSSTTTTTTTTTGGSSSSSSSTSTGATSGGFLGSSSGI